MMAKKHHQSRGIFLGFRKVCKVPLLDVHRRTVVFIYLFFPQKKKFGIAGLFFRIVIHKILGSF